MPSRGIMHFYFDGYDGARTMSFQDVVLEYSDGRRENALSGFAFYEEIPTKIWVYKNSDFNSLGTYEQNLVIEYSGYDEYEKYLTRMQNYSDLSMKIDGTKLKISFKRDSNNVDNVVAIPIAYNDCWKIDKNYKLVKVNGGLLGVIVPKGEREIEFNLEFTPRKLNASALISLCGIAIYMVVVIGYSRRIKEYEENNNYCTLL